MATEPVAACRLVLVPSTLLGPSTWAPVATRLARHGWSVRVPARHDDVRGPEDVLAQLLAETPEGEPVVLVPHSNAGLYVAALAAERDVRGLVFVDARLPSGSASTPTATPEFRAYLGGLAGPDGRHLHQLVDPGAVVAVLEGLLGQLGFEAGS